jgi:hypothetical protein
MHFKIAPIPAISDAVFKGGIDHPDLWLWDSWILKESARCWYLYCLALSRTHSDTTPIDPAQRNDYTFHVRLFHSADAGGTWVDKGAVMQPGQAVDGSDGRNVWSGSVLRLDPGTVAFAFTGVRDCGPDHCFVQSICLATGPSPERVDLASAVTLSCPLRDYDSIVSKGYFLGPKGDLGANGGEGGGPILAWRDPFVFETEPHVYHAVWAAKLAARVPAIAHARLAWDGRIWSIASLSPPAALPDAERMTQAEVPKVYRDPSSGDFLLLISACDRQYEGQPNAEVAHVHRLYRAASPEGPWQPFRDAGSEIGGLDGLFGASFLACDLGLGKAEALGPYTVNAGADLQLRFDKVRQIDLDAAPSGDSKP